MSLSEAEIRQCADSVKFGECITFPNGLVVDKRAAPTPSSPVAPFVPAPAPMPTPANPGWMCPACGTWCCPGSLHNCYRITCEAR